LGAGLTRSESSQSGLALTRQPYQNRGVAAHRARWTSRSCGASVLATRRRPHPRAAGPLVEAQVRARPALAATPMWPCECRAARAASRRRRVRLPRASHGPNYGYRGLLRSRCERPRRSAAEQRDELAPFHSITSSAVVAPGGLTDQPPALATAAPCPNHFGVGSGFIDDQDRPDRLSTSGVLPASTTRSTARSSW
jgi:hypothetical protein